MTDTKGKSSSSSKAAPGNDSCRSATRNPCPNTKWKPIQRNRNPRINSQWKFVSYSTNEHLWLLLWMFFFLLEFRNTCGWNMNFPEIKICKHCFYKLPVHLRIVNCQSSHARHLLPQNPPVHNPSLGCDAPNPPCPEARTRRGKDTTSLSNCQKTIWFGDLLKWT